MYVVCGHTNIAKKNCRIHELLSFVFTLYTVYMHILHVSVLNILTTRVQYNRDKSYSSLIKQITKSMQVIGEAIHSEKKVLCIKIHIPLLFHDHTVYVIAGDVQYQVISHYQC